MSFLEKLKEFNIKEEYSKIHEVFSTFYNNYKSSNSEKLRLIDIFIVFSGFIFIVQVIYAGIIGLYPMNSFLSGIIACIGTMTLLVNLRMHVNLNEKNKLNSNEQVFAEYFIASLILYFVCINFLG
jgi:hypothetical protein